MAMLCSIFAMELCVRMEASSPTRRELHALVASHPRELSAQIRVEVAKWRKVVKEAGLKVE